MRWSELIYFPYVHSPCIVAHSLKWGFVQLFLLVYNIHVQQPYLSVVIPAYDEMANLQKGVLLKVRDFLNSKKYSYEVLVVDDGSKDGSIEFLEAFTKQNKGFTLIKNPHMGKAGTVTTGMLKAKGKYILFTDMDQATPIEEIDKIMPEFEKGYDVVIGSRNTRRKGSPLSRRIISRGLIILRKIIVGLYGLTDTNCGFKAFSNAAAHDIFKRVSVIHNGFQEISGSAVTAGFDIEVLLMAENKGYKIKEVPIQWLYVETRRVNPVGESIDGLVELLRIRKRAMQGRYSRK